MVNPHIAFWGICCNLVHLVQLIAIARDVAVHCSGFNFCSGKLAEIIIPVPKRIGGLALGSRSIKSAHYNLTGLDVMYVPSSNAGVFQG